MLPDDGPIGRDVKTETVDPFGNISSNPSAANLMADPLGTEIVAGLTGPIMAQSLPTDSEEVMGQPPQVNFDGGGGGADAGPNPQPSDDDSIDVRNAEMSIGGLIDRIKNLPAWGWLLTAGVGGGLIYLVGKRMK